MFSTTKKEEFSTKCHFNSPAKAFVLWDGRILTFGKNIYYKTNMRVIRNYTIDLFHPKEKKYVFQGNIPIEVDRKVGGFFFSSIQELVQLSNEYVFLISRDQVCRFNLSTFEFMEETDPMLKNSLFLRLNDNEVILLREDKEEKGTRVVQYEVETRRIISSEKYNVPYHSISAFGQLHPGVFVVEKFKNLLTGNSFDYNLDLLSFESGHLMIKCHGLDSHLFGEDEYYEWGLIFLTGSKLLKYRFDNENGNFDRILLRSEKSHNDQYEWKVEEPLTTKPGFPKPKDPNSWRGIKTNDPDNLLVYDSRMLFLYNLRTDTKTKLYSCWPWENDISKVVVGPSDEIIFYQEAKKANEVSSMRCITTPNLINRHCLFAQLNSVPLPDPLKRLVVNYVMDDQRSSFIPSGPL